MKKIIASLKFYQIPVLTAITVIGFFASKLAYDFVRGTDSSTHVPTMLEMIAPISILAITVAGALFYYAWSTKGGRI